MDVFGILQTKESRLNFLKGLIRIAKSDGILDDKELVYYQQLASSFGMEEDDMAALEKCWNLDDEIQISFETDREKMFFFTQAIQLCWMDEEYAEVEKQEIRQIADSLNISYQAIEAVEAWAYEGIVWNKQGDKLLDLK